MIGPLIAILAFIPAMLANSLAVVFGGGPPIDSGKKWNDNRVLGDGKTWRGLFGGGISAAIVGVILYFIFSLRFYLYPSFPGGLLVIFTLSFGALLGDIGASFVKRRRGVPRGKNSPIMDRYDFIVGAFLLIILIDADWFYQTYIEGDGWIGTIIIIVGVPFLHRAVNILGYKLGLKDEPW
ncbi:MAG: CDP-2,3-bis-(O-geranylgeranyl)-sn-glycerol synthase [Candidatus Thermoplasmatota archaeon]|nr:CDP-2,3-bis-(O-geranylgeranyl)-sn-glycerol synthase [Candidatus Thermoplasmatota archaeon]MBS3789904.1 CDP-2,3-bis-(O-geranylgeranyl)-sn-glycerol synthase [Candidatus Thermoplasmatota archaeon]